MRASDVRSVLTVARHGNLSAAAEELFVAIPTLSETVRRVEIDLGVEMFERSNRGMRLTDRGQQLMPSLSALADAHESLHAISPLRTADVRYVLAVAMTGNLTRAAAHLQLSAPTVSAGVRRVERQLGVELFDRSNRGMRLTDDGRELLPVIASVSDAEHALRRAIDAGQPVASPLTLSIGTLFGYGAMVVQQAAEQLRILGLDLNIQIETSGLDDSSAGIRDGVVDAAVIPGPSSLDAQTEAALLWEERRVLLVHGGHPLADQPSVRVSEIAHLPWLRHQEFDEVWDGFWRLNDVRGGPPQLTDRVCLTPEDLVVALQSGDGVMCTLESLKEVYSMAGLGIVPLSDVPPSPVFLRYLPGRRSPELDRLAAKIQEIVAVAAQPEAVPD